jgi:hypothetical protein
LIFDALDFGIYNIHRPFRFLYNHKLKVDEEGDTLIMDEYMDLLPFYTNIKKDMNKK